MLSQVVNDPLSKLPENIDATENAISAVTKVCKYNHGNIAVDDIIPVWLSWLPIIEDKEEAPHVYGYLCDLIERYVNISEFQVYLTILGILHSGLFASGCKIPTIVTFEYLEYMWYGRNPRVFRNINTRTVRPRSSVAGSIPTEVGLMIFRSPGVEKFGRTSSNITEFDN